MLLTVDVGNTNTVAGVWNGDRLVRSFRLTSPAAWTADDVGLLLRSLLGASGVAPNADTPLEGGAALCSVVPALTGAIEEALRTLFGRPPVVVSTRTVGSLEILYRDPQSVGGDRLADAMAVLRYHRVPAIVVDLGTATTFDVIDGKGRYLGGVIAPGIVTAAQDLFRRAARLAAVELTLPPRVVGQSTEESLQSGILYGAGGQVDGIVRRIAAELDGEPLVVATGGLARTVAQVAETVEVVDEDLTLKGLKVIYDEASSARA